MSLSVSRETKLLFIGDSITDCGRTTDADHLGSGYVRRIRDLLAAKDPSNCPAVINTGISGNRVTHLAARWDRDVIAHSPDIVSIMIGINDVWHGLDGKSDGVGIDEYIATYRKLIGSLRAALPKTKLVLCEPTVICPPSPAEGNERLQPYVRAVNDLGKSLGADVIVPTHGTFRRAQEQRPDLEWTTDGVHPASAGHMLIATTWLGATGLL